jgi:hypothetical protein
MTAFTQGGTSHRGNKNKGSIQTWVATLAPTGADGSATARVDIPMRGGRGGGILLAVGIEIGGQPNTTDITIEDFNGDGDLVVFTNVSADVVPHMIVGDAVDDDGAAAADVGEGLPFYGGLSVELAQGDVFVSATEDNPAIVTMWVKR